MQTYRTSPTATPEMLRSAHRSTALAWIAFPSVNPGSPFREAKCGPNPLKCQCAGWSTLMPRLRARSACVLQGFCSLGSPFYEKNSDSTERRLLLWGLFDRDVTRRGDFRAHEIA